MALTDRFLKNWKPGKSVQRKRDNASDPELRGFGAMIYRSGVISFYVAYTSPETGERTTLNFGRYPAISLKAAREACRAARGLLDVDMDPKLQADRERASADAETARLAGRGTVADLFAFHIEDMRIDGKRSADEVERSYEFDIEKDIGSMFAADVTADDIADILAKIAGRGARVQVNRTRAYLHAAFKFGIHAKRRPRWHNKLPDFGLRHNVVSEIERDKDAESVGDRALSREELVRLWAAVDAAGMARRSALAIKMLVATGQRVEEVIGMTVGEINREEGIWVLPPSRRKKNDEHTVPLTDLHLALIDEALEISGSDFLFPHKDGKQVMKSDGLGQTVKRLCKDAGIEHFTPRDLRRTWKTLAGSIGLDLEIRNRVQGHAFQDVGSKHYDRYAYLPEKRKAMARWCGWLEGQVSGEDNVVRLA